MTLVACEWSIPCPGSFISRKESRYALKNRLNGPHNLSGGFGEHVEAKYINLFQPARTFLSFLVEIFWRLKYLLISREAIAVYLTLILLTWRKW